MNIHPILDNKREAATIEVEVAKGETEFLTYFDME